MVYGDVDLVVNSNIACFFEFAYEMCKIIFYHLKLAREAIENLFVVEDKSLFFQQLDDLEQSKKQAEDEQRETVDFFSYLSLNRNVITMHFETFA